MWPERLDMRPEQLDLRPERLDLGPERLDLRPEGPDEGEGGTNERTDERKSPCVLQDFVPFGATALLPLNLKHTLLKQGTGTADHLLPLGCYYFLHFTIMNCHC